MFCVVFVVVVVAKLFEECDDGTTNAWTAAGAETAARNINARAAEVERAVPSLLLLLLLLLGLERRRTVMVGWPHLLPHLWAMKHAHGKTDGDGFSTNFVPYVLTALCVRKTRKVSENQRIKWTRSTQVGLIRPNRLRMYVDPFLAT